MDPYASPLCPTTATARRNPPRRARPTPKALNSREIPPFPHDDDILSTAQTPSTSPEIENLKVFLRIRPILPPNQAPRPRAKTAWPQNSTRKNNVAPAASKKKSSTAVCLSVNDSQSVTLSTPSTPQEPKRIKSETYGGFSHVFPSESSQSEVYERMVRPMVDEFLKGRSGMLAALGPSGSGKTHTVFGSSRDPGMVPLTLRHIFEETQQISKQASRSYYISIFEIYTERGKTEKLLDLLPNGSELSMQQSTVKGMQEVLISNAEQADSLIAQAMLKRATAMTNTNSQSSRSQCIISIRDVPQKCKGVVNCKSNGAVLTIIDLAGAEREKRTGNQGTRLIESNFINNTLMVFGLCLRSLLEHQKNPKKPLQKHFQNSMLTRYLRDYLEGKKRMTLILTAKSGEDDYLDTSYLLRQASPYMQIKYNEVETPNMVPNKRHYQASIMDHVKQSPSLEHKRVKLVRERTVQNDKQDVEECNTSKEDASTVCKLDTSSTVSFKLECDDSTQSERSHIIMRNFAKVIWNCLKDYKSELKVAQMEIHSLKESIEYEKKKSLELEMQLNEFKACCTCCEGGKEKNDTKDCSSVGLDHPHNWDQDQEETFHAQSSFEPRLNLVDEEPVLGSSCTELDSEKSDREDSVSSPNPEHLNALEVDAVNKIPSETLHTKSSYENILDQSDQELTLGTSFTEVDSEKANREFSVLSKPGHHNALEVDAVSNIPSETFHAQSSFEPRLNLLDEEPVLGSSCTELDSEKSDREVSVSSPNPEHLNALEVDAVNKIPSVSSETLHTKSSYENILDQSDEELTLGTSLTEIDSENSNRKLSASLSKPGHHNVLEVDAASKIPSETFHSESSSEPRLDQSDEESVLGTSCPVIDSEKSDREVSISSLKPGDHEATEVDTMRKIPSETFQTQSSSEPRFDMSNEEPMLATPSAQLDSKKSNRGVSASSSKTGDHNALEVDAVSKIPSEMLVSLSLTNDDILDPSSPKDVSSTKTHDVPKVVSSTKANNVLKDVSSTKAHNVVVDPSGEKTGVNNSEPPRPKRTLRPSSSIISRPLSTFDLSAEPENSKENRNTRKVAAHDPIRSNGSISLLHLLQGRKSKTHL